MATSKVRIRQDLQTAVRAALARAEACRARYRPWDLRLLVVSIVCGALATLLAGGTIAGGPDAARAWFGGWRILCAIVAMLTATGTVASALHRSLQITSRVASAEKCITRLRALDATLGAAAITSEEALDTFRQISEEHSDCLA